MMYTQRWSAIHNQIITKTRRATDAGSASHLPGPWYSTLQEVGIVYDQSPRPSFTMLPQGIIPYDALHIYEIHQALYCSVLIPGPT